MKIVVTGGSGMVGRSILNILTSDDEIMTKWEEHKFIYLSSGDVDLTDRKRTLDFFMYAQADYIIHLAANVGGLYKNQENNIKMFSDNIKINENVLECCLKNQIRRGIFVLSSCIYPINPSKPFFSFPLVFNSTGSQFTLPSIFLTLFLGQNCKLPALGLLAVGIFYMCNISFSY